MRTKALFVIAVVALVAVGCGGSSTTSSTTIVAEVTTTTTGSIVNVWKGPPTDRTKLPIGTSKVSLTSPSIGGLWACRGGDPRGGGAQVAGPWIDPAAGTWDATTKVDVQGSVSWPTANYSEEITSAGRRISSNGVPVGAVTGNFPIARSDPAFAYDRNPNAIGESAIDVTLPVDPKVSSSPSCLSMGTIGVLKNGVALFAPIDQLNRDAVAYETQDVCDGHPEVQHRYHYHDIPSCILDASTGPSTVVGYAYDGHPIVVERDANGALPTNADLDQCHGRTSPVLVDGRVVTTYHYSATYEFPYWIGCFTSAPI